MTILRWQWRLANAGLVTAAIDRDGTIETVSQATRVLSEAPRGSRPDGHTVVVSPEQQFDRSERPPIEAVVTFDPTAPICILRVEGQEVAPTAWPVRERRLPPPPPSRSRGSPLLALVVGGLLLATIAFIALRRTGASEADAKLEGTHRSNNGLFVAHFPADLEARAPVLPSGVGGVLLENKAKSVTIVIAAFTLDATTSRDPWAIQQRIRDEALANVPKGAAHFEESVRRDDTCSGETGAVVMGNLLHDGTRRGRVGSCAFTHNGSGYLTLYMLAEPTSAAEERRIRAVVDATELTRLADLGGPPESPPPLVPR